MRLTLFAATVLAAVALTGCGDVPRGRLHGTVKYQGKPLTGATVIFLAGDNKTHLAKLKPDGTYDVSGVALGTIKVSIQQDLPEVASKADPRSAASRSQSKSDVTDEKAAKAPAAPPPPAPEKTDWKHRLPVQYADAEKSGLTFELKESDQDWSVDLK
jgi:hypothetical protein